MAYVMPANKAVDVSISRIFCNVVMAPPPPLPKNNEDNVLFVGGGGEAAEMPILMYVLPPAAGAFGSTPKQPARSQAI